MDIDPQQLSSRVTQVVYKGEMADINNNYDDNLVTAANIDYYERMSIEDFKEKELPNLYVAPGAEGEFYRYIIRDLSNWSIFTLRPDEVIKYKVKRLVEMPADKWLERVLAKRQQMAEQTVINSPVPVYSYSLEGSNKKCIIKLPPTTFLFRHTEGLDAKITLPPLLYGIHMVGQSIRNSYVTVITKDNPDPHKMEFGFLSLPNVYSDQHICVGTTSMQDTTSSDNVFDMAYKSWQLFIGSLWNYDLFYTNSCPSNLVDVFKSEYRHKEDGTKLAVTEITERASCYLKMLLTVLKDPAGWSKLKWLKEDAPRW